MLRNILDTFVPFVVQAIEFVGVGIIALGSAITLAMFLVALVKRVRVEDAIGRFRSDLGRSILLGLEFLVAADIISTVVIDLTLQSVAALAGIVFIRTLLSFSLEAEIDGRWPWQRAAAEKAERD
ncbi:MAG: DUF1622 domain-containing protein [Sphingomonas sp.]|uniref:DUF1622 domain-containing protein n=1 Tax=Sphingomonas sp. TaxID=28214 RepID=UPI0017E09704|nr:DUF1622 domain-containing protein [Sphingomonas sp.]MBA3666421.1 DUF1622 domain-containing protein [Sphingomonas sp.]